MSCKYHRHAKHQEERIRRLEHELKIAKEEIRKLKAGNVSSSNSSSIKEKTNLESWNKPKNSKSRYRRFSADDAEVKLSNRFSVLETDSLSVGQQSQVLSEHEGKKVMSVAKKARSKRKILLLGSSHGREIGPMLKEGLGDRFDIVSIIKPNAPLANVVEDLGKLGKDLTKQDHIIIVGGPGNSLDRNFNYSIEEDINNIAERTVNTNVGFVSLFRRHDKPWMNGEVRKINLRLERALMGSGGAHIGIINSDYFVRGDFTAHGLHLNSQGKRKLTHLIAERMDDGHVSEVSSIPVITCARAMPFLD